jgi:glutamyl-Q tRNA(Asp) synthetase
MTPESSSPSTYRGRFAPSPTGALHLGSLLAAVGSWLRARQCGGQWLVRMEDLDPPREVAGASAAILAGLAGFGLVPDGPVRYQSGRGAAYAEALARLVDAGLAFPCRCSRAQVEARGGHHGRCAGTADATGAGAATAWRLRVAAGEVAFTDAIQGRYRQDVGKVVGDVVLRRRDGLWAYQLAVVVDDADQGVTEVVRGADLLDSTPRQIVLQRALGLATPAYAHLPVLLDDAGHKLSKQARSLPVDPADPLPALRLVLRLLGVPAGALPAAGGPAQLLAAALPRFELARVPAVPSLRSAAWQPMANG